MANAREFRLPLPRSRTALRRAYQICVLLSLIAVAPLSWAWLSSDPYRVTADSGARWLDAVPASQTALVLGAGIRDGRPTPMLAARLDIAADLYRAGKVKAILLSGDNSRVEYDEPGVMRDYLVGRGIPAAVQVLDYAGFDTWDSCVRARQVFGARQITVVTQQFHLPRAVALCRTAGLAAFGVGDDSARRWASTYVYAVREFAAAAKGFLDAVVLRSEPYFPGPRETSLERVLAG
ncbi:protein SanA, affects membrane permeability for vancomycin [Sinosporangium album]|uniref:Protein SanA, affects membrane permeability for vancomycin n=1 Tax=Sinosporangium album TaxID=504805 RepID=A0A1G7WIR0_9ACTN|nr:ElyC/SanA/YdcF family protein [Sinosporangium album]SDG71881.1 protein SanA, affects membrane permeability for vancomycin [Sinosporangium album]